MSEKGESYQDDLIASNQSAEINESEKEDEAAITPNSSDKIKELDRGGHENVVFRDRGADAEMDQLQLRAPSTMNLYKEPLDSMHLDEAFNDDVKDMTYGRLVARRLAKYRWYNPYVSEKYEQKLAENDQVDPPSLDSAWTYFEHYALPRHLLVSPRAKESDENNKSVFFKKRSRTGRLLRAKFGENDVPTKLYNLVHTPEADLADFGVGVGIYFWNLRVLAIIMLLAGFINLPTMIYFSSDDYSTFGQAVVSTFGVKGSAVCTDQEWVACPTCQRSDWQRFPSAYERFASTGSLTFILRNNCTIFVKEGIVALVSLLFVTISLYVMGRVSQRREIEYDLNQQTTPDYSLLVRNPPHDARDPDEWRDFFSQFEGAHVTCCTVVLDNEELIRALVTRRKMVLQIEYLMRPGIQFDRENLDEMVKHCFPVPLWRKVFMLASDASVLLPKIRAMEKAIKDLATKDTSASSVFVTFETEQSQRHALRQLSVRLLDIWRKDTSRVPDNLLFRGNHLLSVIEPPEPSSVRWQDLDETKLRQILQAVAATLVSVIGVTIGAVLIALTRRRSSTWAAIVISILNQVTPFVCRWITNQTESHSSDGLRQASLYIKMTFFRWVNTVIITTIILPFSDAVTDGNRFLINSVYAIFFSELLLTPFLQISDMWGNFQRHFMGPRAPDQKRMNLNFRGAYFQLAERFTGMTKILFLTLFYAAFYPGGFFFAAVTFFVIYWTDKFCLFRVWGPAPMIGTQVAEFSRSYFVSLALLAYAIMLSYNYAGFPFDNACATETTVSDAYVGTYPAMDGNGANISVSIDEGDLEYFYCLQDMFRLPVSPRAFPAIAKFQPEGEEWMNPDQERVSNMIGWTSIAILALVSIIFVNRILIRFLKRVFRSPYKPSGKATDIAFSDVRDIFGYVPQVSGTQFEYPLLVCDVSNVDHELIGWEDDAHGFDEHNLIYDIPGLAEDSDHPVFSIVKQWGLAEDETKEDEGRSDSAHSSQQAASSSPEVES